jgi:glycosyltransferase involved in cell wall biosynthesis
MRIGIICQNFPPASFEGGISHYSHKLAEHLTLRGHEVFAITSTEFSKADNGNSQANGTEIVCINGPWSMKSVLSIKRKTQQLQLDTIILQYSPASYDWRFRLLWAITPFACNKITAFHTLWGGEFDKIIGLLNLLGGNQIIATNSEIMTILENWVPGLLKKTIWIPIGSNIAPLSTEQKPTINEVPLISFFGMMYPGKGLNLILDVLSQLKIIGCKFNFKFVGGGMLGHREYELHYKNKIEKRELSDCIEHLGLISESEVSYWLNQSRFLFLPYERGLSDRRGSFMAGIAHQKAILTSPPIVEMRLLVNGDNVIWPENPTVAGYVEKMEEMIRDDNMIARIEAGAAKIADYFSWDNIANDYELAINQRQ